MEMHHILGTIDEFMEQAGHGTPTRIHPKGSKEEFVKEFRLVEPEEPTPSNPYVSP